MAQTLVSRSTSNVFFRDISLSFTANPLTGDILLRQDLDAIKDSIRNLVLLNKGERPFKSNIGGGLYSLLFARFTIATKTVFENSILTTISDNEPRVDNVSVAINRIEANTIEVVVQFQIIGSTEQQLLTVSVTRND